MKQEETTRHPSFATIHFSRISGHSGYLFGSEIQANNYIELEIREAERIIDLCDERQFPHGETICKVKMSPSQFSELITTLNFSLGTPCTLEEVMGQRVPQVNTEEVESRKSFVNRKLKERLKWFASHLTETQQKARELVKKKTLSKYDQRELLNAIDFMTTELTSNIPFFAKCFQENMDDVILDAKIEIDSTIQHMITQSGLKALAGYTKPTIREIE